MQVRIACGTGQLDLDGFVTLKFEIVEHADIDGRRGLPSQHRHRADERGVIGAWRSGSRDAVGDDGIGVGNLFQCDCELTIRARLGGSRDCRRDGDEVDAAGNGRDGQACLVILGAAGIVRRAVWIFWSEATTSALLM